MTLSELFSDSIGIQACALGTINDHETSMSCGIFWQTHRFDEIWQKEIKQVCFRIQHKEETHLWYDRIVAIIELKMDTEKEI